MMNIVYASDDGYSMQLGISLLSLLENHKKEDKINIYVLDAGIRDEQREYICQIVRTYQQRIHWICVDGFESRFLTETLDGHGYNPIVYARLLLSELLPEKIDYILYLDCDVIVNHSLKNLFAIAREWDKYNTCGNWLVAAVPELYMPSFIKKRTINFQPRETYYNAGVLLINLRRWREEGTEQRFLEYQKRYSKRIKFNDQDIINACCRGRIVTLPQRYNMNPNLPWFPRWYMKMIQPAYYFEPKKWDSMIRNPYIIHYMGDERPWVSGSRNYYRELYEKYKKRSPWRDMPAVRGKENYMKIYHVMNVVTKVFPLARTIMTNLVGIHWARLLNNL